MSGKRNIGISFGSVATRISRGIQLKAEQLKSCLTDVETDYRYLSLADLKDDYSFQLDPSGLRYFDPSKLGKDVQQFCLKPNMILLTKNDTPFKVQIAGNSIEQNIVVAGNIYMITVDEEKVIPRWLCYWLQSEEGMARIRSAAATTSKSKMRWLSIRQLEGVMIPRLSLKKQANMLIAKLGEYNQWLVKLTQEFDRNSQEILEIYHSLGFYDHEKIDDLSGNSKQDSSGG